MTKKLVKYRNKKQQRKKYTRKSVNKNQRGGKLKKGSRKYKKSARKAKQKGGKAKKNIKKPDENNLMKTLEKEFSSGFFVIDTGLGRSAQPDRIKKLENIYFQREQEKNNTPEEKLSSVKVNPQQKNSSETLMGAISKGLTEGRQARSQVQTALSTARSSIDSITSGMGVPEARISDSLSGIGKQMGQVFNAPKGKRSTPRAISRPTQSIQKKTSAKKPSKPQYVPPTKGRGPTQTFYDVPSSTMKPPTGERQRIGIGEDYRTAASATTIAQPSAQPSAPPLAKTQTQPLAPPLAPPLAQPNKGDPNRSKIGVDNAAPPQNQQVLNTGSKTPPPAKPPQNLVCPCCNTIIADLDSVICGVKGGDKDDCIKYFSKEDQGKK